MKLGAWEGIGEGLAGRSAGVAAGHSAAGHGAAGHGVAVAVDVVDVVDVVDAVAVAAAVAAAAAAGDALHGLRSGRLAQKHTHRTRSNLMVDNRLIVFADNVNAKFL